MADTSPQAAQIRPRAVSYHERLPLNVSPSTPTITLPKIKFASVTHRAPKASGSGGAAEGYWTWVPVFARLRPWYVRRIWDVTVTRACAGWDIKIRSYHVRPADASIFTYAALGDLASCRKLIERGLASPFDVAFPFYPFNSPTHVLCVSCSVCVNSFIRVLADGDSSMQHHRATLICVAT